MGKKAVYNNQHLAIYITREDLEALIIDQLSFFPLFIGKGKTRLGSVRVDVDSTGKQSLSTALGAERQAVQEIQDQFARDHPDYENSSKTQEKKQRGRKRLRKRTNDID